MSKQTIATQVLRRFPWNNMQGTVWAVHNDIQVVYNENLASNIHNITFKFWKSLISQIVLTFRWNCTILKGGICSSIACGSSIWMCEQHTKRIKDVGGECQAREAKWCNEWSWCNDMYITVYGILKPSQTNSWCHHMLPWLVFLLRI